jgi:ubiquinone/menaquinone biosynthesis C-methylase UbiE
MAAMEDVTRFTSVDRTQDPGFYCRFLEQGNALADIQAAKPIILDGLRLSSGKIAADFGCGTGDDAVAMARLVGPTGRVVGIDISETMIDEARRRTDTLDLPVEYHVGDCLQLAFDDATFDACRTERMLMHVPEAERAFAEIVRVTRPGGRLSVFDFDWDTMVIDSVDRDNTRAVVRSFSDSIKTGWIGRRLPRMFRSSGLTDLTVVPHVVRVHFEFFELLVGGHLSRAQEAGVISAQEAETWWGGLRQADRDGDFLAAFTAFMVAGTKS